MGAGLSFCECKESASPHHTEDVSSEPAAGEAKAGDQPAAGAGPAEAPAPEVPTTEAPAEKPAAADPAPPKLTVAIVGARGFRKADWVPGSDKSDCYCTLKSGDKELHKTSGIGNKPEPLWQEEAEVTEYAENEPLEFSLWVAGDLLGQFTLPSSAFDPTGFNGELKLEGGTGKDSTVTAFLKVKVKMAKREYPEPQGPPAEITITAERDPKKKKVVGVELDTSDGMHAIVTRVTEGPFQTYNKDAKPSEVLKPGDFIMKVNDEAGTAKQLADAMQKAASWKLLVRRPEEVCVVIDKKEPKADLGLQFQKKPAGTALLITQVAEGPFQEWNSANKDQEVRIGDRIVAVGPHRGKAKDLQKKMADASKFQVTLVRPACPNTSIWFQ